MQVSITKSEGLTRQLDVTIPAAEVSKRFTARLDQLAKTMKIDGFRPGHVPLNVVKQRVGDQIGGEVANMLVNEFLPKAIESEKLSIAGQPHVHVGGGHDAGGEAKEGEDFHFHAHLDLMPEFEPKGYTGLKLVKPVADVTDEMVDEALSRLQTQMQTFEAKEGTADKGDRVTITGQGYAKEGKEEKAFEGGNLENFKVVLGSGSLIPGFEEGLIDTKVGDEVDVEVTFPKEYHAAELAGKPAVFKLKVEGIEAPKDGEMTDETAKQFGFENLDGLKDVLRKSAQRDLTNASEQRLKRQMLDELEKANDFDLPGNMVAAEHNALWQAQMRELQQRGLGLEALGKAPEEVQKELEPLAKRRVKLGLVMAEIAKKEGLKVEAADLNTAVQAQIQMAGPQAEQAKQFFADPRNRQQLAGPILEDKVSSFILGKAEVKEEKLEAKDLLSELQ
ncbi:MAG: trigger factor [Alphaproteobacteria bacterium CG_4_10_14_0_8_um_filter_53_9]|nr:MAG: trigger factor [Alphaproteobacteria bacterium CG_4_10_14_0_8_um_filter_53_9]